MLEVLFLEIMSGIKDVVKVERCPKGHPVSDEMKFCPVCGAEIAVGGMRFCPNCGQKRQTMDRFCTNCGFSFDQKEKEEKDDGFSFFGFLLID